MQLQVHAMHAMRPLPAMRRTPQARPRTPCSRPGRCCCMLLQMLGLGTTAGPPQCALWRPMPRRGRAAGRARVPYRATPRRLRLPLCVAAAAHTSAPSLSGYGDLGHACVPHWSPHTEATELSAGRAASGSCRDDAGRPISCSSSLPSQQRPSTRTLQRCGRSKTSRSPRPRSGPVR
eukprot:365632-Chlamydomonas_euryale.AAC.29